jgi:hypothetical protein
MRIRTSRRGWLALVITVVAAGGLAGAVVAGQLRGGDVSPEFQAALHTEPLFEVAEIPAGDGFRSHGVFVQPTSVGFTCLWDAADASTPDRHGSCNPSSDPFGGHKIFFGLAYDGGPATSDVRDARVLGIVAPAVATVRALMSDGTYRTVALRDSTIQGRSYRAFGYRFRSADLRRGLGPVAVVAFDASGTEIDRQTTGFGG